MSRRDRTPPPNLSRRERRAAERAARARPPGASPGRQGGSSGFSGGWVLAGVSAIAVVVALILIVALNGGLPGGSASIVAPRQLTPTDLADGLFLGRSDAPTLVIWSDYQCPFCGRFARETEPTLISEYVEPGKLRLEYRDFAFLGRESTDSATAARCAGEQGKGRFWTYHDYLYANQRGENLGAFDRAHLEAIAKAMGLDLAAFGACFDGGTARAAVEQQTREGGGAGVTSTPTLAIGGKTYPGIPPYDQLRSIIEEALAGGATPSPTPAATPTPSGGTPSATP